MPRLPCLLLLLLLLPGLLACGPNPPVLDARFAAGRTTEGLERLAARMRVPEGENIHVIGLGADADTSHHLVGVRDREPYHRHDGSALTAVVLSGRGRMKIDGEERAVGEGSVIYVPRGTPHAFINWGNEPAVAYVIFSPPFDPADRVAVEEAP